MSNESTMRHAAPESESAPATYINATIRGVRVRVQIDTIERFSRAIHRIADVPRRVSSSRIAP